LRDTRTASREERKGRKELQRGEQRILNSGTSRPFLAILARFA
jgi:hypothetical protein